MAGTMPLSANVQEQIEEASKVPYEETDEYKKFEGFVEFVERYTRNCERVVGKGTNKTAGAVALAQKTLDKKKAKAQQKVEDLVARYAKGGNSYLQKPYRIGAHADSVDSDGCGMFATQKILKGDLVVRDRSVLKHAGAESFTEEVSTKWFKTLDEKDQRAVLALKSYTSHATRDAELTADMADLNASFETLSTEDGGSPSPAESVASKKSEEDKDREARMKQVLKTVHNVVRTNSFREEGHRVLYPTLSRINHSCQPNVWQQAGAIFALRDIEDGEEICWCYPQGVILNQDISIAEIANDVMKQRDPLATSLHSHFLFMDSAAQREHLLKNYEFECACKPCKSYAENTTQTKELMKEIYNDMLTDCVVKRYNKVESYMVPEECKRNNVNLSKPEFDSAEAEEQRNRVKNGRSLEEKNREKLQIRLREFMTYFDLLNVCGGLHGEDWGRVIELCDEFESLMKQAKLTCRRVETTVAMVRSLYEACRLPALVRYGEEVLANKDKMSPEQIEGEENEMLEDIDPVIKRTEDALKQIVMCWGKESGEVGVFKSKLTQLLYTKGLLEFITYND